MLKPQKVDENGYMFRFFKNSLKLVFNNPLTFTTLFLMMGLVSYLCKESGSETLLLFAQFFFGILILEICYGTTREKYNHKKFIVSMVLTVDFLKKILKEKNFWILGLILVILSLDILSLAVDMGLISKTEPKPQLNPDGTLKEVKESFIFLKEWVPYFSTPVYLLPLFVDRFDLGRFFSDDYYSYRYEGAFQKEEVKAYSPTGHLNKNVTMVLHFSILAFVLFSPSFMVLKTIGSVVLLMMMAQYSMEAYGDDGLKKKQEQEKEKEVENLIPDNT